MALTLLTAPTSCSLVGTDTVRYPTVQEMDDRDLEWGLGRRSPLTPAPALAPETNLPENTPITL